MARTVAVGPELILASRSATANRPPEGSVVIRQSRFFLAALSLALLITVQARIPFSAWLILLLASAVALVLHSRTQIYALLVAGAFLFGSSVGVLLEVALNWSGAFFVSIGSAGIAVEALEERGSHWALTVGLSLIGLGLLLGVIDAGTRTVLLAVAMFTTVLLVRALLLRRARAQQEGAR